MDFRRLDASQRNWKSYFLALIYLYVLTILGSLLSLNRLGGITFEFNFRNYLEHFIAGICFPSVWVILVIAFCMLLRIVFSRSFELGLLIFFSIIWILFEIWFQFINSFNEGSFIQIFFYLLGVFLFWVFYCKFLLKVNE